MSECVLLKRTRLKRLSVSKVAQWMTAVNHFKTINFENAHFETGFLWSCQFATYLLWDLKLLVNMYFHKHPSWAIAILWTKCLTTRHILRNYLYAIMILWDMTCLSQLPVWDMDMAFLLHWPFWDMRLLIHQPFCG